MRVWVIYQGVEAEVVGVIWGRDYAQRFIDAAYAVATSYGRRCLFAEEWDPIACRPTGYKITTPEADE